MAVAPRPRQAGLEVGGGRGPQRLRPEPDHRRRRLHERVDPHHEALVATPLHRDGRPGLLPNAEHL